MTLSYLFRLLCLCLGCFFAVQLAVGLLVGSCAPIALRIAGRLKPCKAAHLLLVLRLLPSAVALVVVVVFCVPSYLWLEPRTVAQEEMSLEFSASALCGTAILGMAFARTLAASVRSLRYIRQSRRAGRPLNASGTSIWLVDQEEPQLMLAGVFRPLLIIARSVAETLSPEQLDTALAHEQAHWTSRDNLKRLLLLLAPGVFPLAQTLERAWSLRAEWAADDRAVAGDPARSLSLAAALVAIARMGTPIRSHALSTSLLADTDELSIRVDRLLATVPCGDDPVPSATRWPAIVVVITGALAALAMQPAALYAVHRLLERLVH